MERPLTPVSAQPAIASSLAVLPAPVWAWS